MNKDAQVVVITGAAQGIGRAMATRFHESGAKLALLDIRPDLFEGWATEWGPEILLINCNIARKAEVEAARDKVLARWGRIDVLVNNAGILPPRAPLESVKEEDWRQVIDVLLTGTFLCTQAFGAPMLDRGGAIVNISSIAGLFPSPTRGAYSASKAAVLLLTQQTALEWGPRKVRVNAVCPGQIETPMTKALYAVPGAREARSALVPWGRVGQPEDIANVVFFLASPESDYMNGEFLRVDGGFTLTPMLPLGRL